ncbi:MAG TPA: hypothetical protein VK578_03285 [Edaphobacter sp.]|nr:hypothetical protein [Edaphobacter sp.]
MNSEITTLRLLLLGALSKPDPMPSPDPKQAVKPCPTATQKVCPPPTTKAAKSPPKSPALYSLTGFDFDLDRAKWGCRNPGCVELYRGLTPFLFADDNFQVVSNTNAVLSLSDTAAQTRLDDARALSNATTKRDQAVADATKAGKKAADIDKAGKDAYTKAMTDSKKLATAKAANRDPAYDFKTLRWIYHTTDNDAYEWDLSVPADAATAVVSNPILNVGDSTQVIFSGGQARRQGSVPDV